MRHQQRTDVNILEVVMEVKFMIVEFKSKKRITLVEYNLQLGDVIEVPNIVFRYDANEIRCPYTCFTLHTFFIPREIIFAKACPLTCSIEGKKDDGSHD